MNRKKFIKQSLITGALGALTPSLLKAKNVKLKQSNYNQFMDQVGFNHLPNQENMSANTVLHKAESRGHANHGWLNSYHSFSFANYHNPQRMHFGVLRVLNDDQVAPAKGFNTHPHDNMEIISIPLSGDLEHKDSIGNKALIKEGDIQVMSAGTGIFHSEYNKNTDQEVRFLQIWLFPKVLNVEPRYDQITLSEIKKANTFYQVLSPSLEDQGVAINQDAWFHMGEFSEPTAGNYKIKKSGNGLYVFVLEGEISILDEKLSKRDGFGIWDTNEINYKASENSKVLLMEVPMSI